MGASGWDYRAPFAGSVEQTLVAEQERILAAGDFIWPWDDLEPDDVEEFGEIGRPTSLAELAAAKEVEEFWDEGTHTLLDVDAVWSESGPQFGKIVPLTEDELQRTFGTITPSGADYDRLYRRHQDGAHGDLVGQKWSGRCVVLFRDDAPTEVCFWGWSGD